LSEDEGEREEGVSVWTFLLSHKCVCDRLRKSDMNRKGGREGGRGRKEKEKCEKEEKNVAEKRTKRVRE